MTWHPDMGTATMVDAGEHVRTVGWLSAAHPYTRGAVPEGFVARLQEFATKWFDSTCALGWGFAMGQHCCELCREVWTGGNFGVPSEGLLFVAPEMLPHYVEAHGYRPPDAFIAAVQQSPLPGTAEYAAAVEQFRQLHVQLQERRYQQTIETAGRWASEHGGTPESIRLAASTYFAGASPELYERIRRAMPNEKADV